MLELKGVYTQDSKVGVEEIYLKLVKNRSSYILSVVRPDGSNYACGTLLSLRRGDNGKLDIYRHSSINPKLKEIFNLDADRCLTKK